MIKAFFADRVSITQDFFKGSVKKVDEKFDQNHAL